MSTVLHGSGPSSGDPANTANGEETYRPAPDIVAYNNSGPDIGFRRVFRSSELRDVPITYDLPLGWYSNYDIRVSLTANAMSVWYPTSVTDVLQKETQGQVSRYFKKGRSFYGDAWMAGGTQFARLTYRDGHRETFTIDTDDGYGYLTQISDREGHYVVINRHAHETDVSLDMQLAHRIESIASSDGNVRLDFAHGDPYPTDGSLPPPNANRILSITEYRNNVAKRKVVYSYERLAYTQPSTDAHPDPYPTYYAAALRSVSQIVEPSDPAPIRAQYGYVISMDDYAYLSTVTTRDAATGALNRTATINYAGTDIDGPVGQLVDANGNHRDYSYLYVNHALDSDPTAVPGTGGPRYINGTKVGVFNYLDVLAQEFTVLWEEGSYRYAGYRDAVGRTTMYYYNDAYTDSLKVELLLDENGLPIQKGDGQQITKVVRPDGSYSQYSYDEYGNRLSERNHCGLITYFDYAYDFVDFPLGRLTAVRQEKWSADGSSRLAARTLQELAYDAYGRVHEVVKPAPAGSGATRSDRTTVYTYNEFGDVASIDAPGNNSSSRIVSSYEFSSPPTKRQPTCAKIAGSTRCTYAYDEYGNLTEVTDAAGHLTRVEYSLCGQPMATYAPESVPGSGLHARVVSTRAYPGGPITRIDLFAEGTSATPVRSVNYTYGHEGELLSLSGKAESTSFTYDAAYHPTSVTDGSGHATHYVYNSCGLITDEYQPGYTWAARPRDHKQIAYKPNGLVDSITDGRGICASFLYTDCGLRQSVSYSNGEPSTIYTYDHYNQLASVSNGNATTEYTYDDLGNAATVETTYVGMVSTNDSKLVEYAYWPSGARKSLTIPSGAFVYSYDGMGRLTGMTNPFGEPFTWQYYANDWLATQTGGDYATRVDYTYDGRGFRTDQLNYEWNNVTLVSRYQSTYDADGNRTVQSVTSDYQAYPDVFFPGTSNFTYNSRGELWTESSTRGGSYSYTHQYDGAGNPTALRGQVGLTYNVDNQRTGPGTYVYDGNGNPTTHRGVSLTFNACNQLTTFGSVVTLGYSADGLRIKKQRGGGAGGGWTYYLYDGLTPIAEMDSTGAITAVNTFGPNGLAARRVGSVSTFYLYDPQGNVAQRLDNSGNIVSSDLYDAYGNRRAGGNNSDPFGYGGQFGLQTDRSQDGTDSVVSAMYRSYDPATGRWIGRDPIGSAGGTNLYRYVGGNPVTFADPTGLEFDNISKGPMQLWPDPDCPQNYYECYRECNADCLAFWIPAWEMYAEWGSLGTAGAFQYLGKEGAKATVQELEMAAAGSFFGDLFMFNSAYIIGITKGCEKACAKKCTENIYPPPPTPRGDYHEENTDGLKYTFDPEFRRQYDLENPR